MKKYEVLMPIAWGGRREKGEIIDMPEKEAINIGAEYLKEVTGATTTEEEVTSKEGIQAVGELWGFPVYTSDQLPANSATAVSTKLTKDELIAKATELGLKTSGTKADLLERVTLATTTEEEVK